MEESPTHIPTIEGELQLASANFYGDLEEDISLILPSLLVLPNSKSPVPPLVLHCSKSPVPKMVAPNLKSPVPPLVLPSLKSPVPPLVLPSLLPSLKSRLGQTSGLTGLQLRFVPLAPPVSTFPLAMPWPSVPPTPP
ncbi:hypothetical protein PO909_016836 [Leuciscus waleckii]